MAKTGRLPKAKATPSLRHREAKDRTTTTTTTTKSAADAAVEDLGAAAAEAAHAQLGKWAWLLGVILACVKSLMIPAYRSTDFEVHRNWLAITHSLPLKDWYYESTSEWTLDYPPFFAYFEFLLSQLGAMVDPGMVVVKNLNYASTATVVFQRLSVIATDFLLVYACKEWSQSRFTQLLSRSRGDSSSSSSSSSAVARVSSLKHAQMIVSFLFLANFGLFLVDHVHFQYNGFLFAFLLLAVTRVFQRRHVEAAFFFAALLNLKHIYLYVAPAFFVYLLKICFSQFDGRGRVVPSSFSVVKLATIALPVLLSFALSFGPFFRHLPQVLSRLFPFKRGLCHAYWAPNVWALYNVADKAALFALRALFGVEMATEAASMSGGLVREYSHAVLMPITPPTSTLLTLVTLAPALINLWRCYPTPTRFVRVLILCAFSFFLFGWHVHEKAVLMMILPFTLIALETREDKKLFFLLSTAGHYSLFPLVFTPAEAPIKVLYFVAFTFASYRFLDADILPCSSASSSVSASASASASASSSASSDQPLLNRAEKTYVVGFAFLQAYVGLGHGLLGLGQSLPFLPLMITSCYCAIGVLYVWIKFYIHTTKLPL